MSNCPVCGGIIPEGVTSCPSCGAFLNNQNQVNNQPVVATDVPGAPTQQVSDPNVLQTVAAPTENMVPTIPDLSKSQVMNVQQQVAAQEQAKIDAEKAAMAETAPPQVEQQDPNAPQQVSMEQIHGTVTNPNEKVVDYSEEAKKIKSGPSKLVVVLAIVLVVGLVVFGGLWFLGGE